MAAKTETIFERIAALQLDFSPERDREAFHSFFMPASISSSIIWRTNLNPG
jgi:hypothetical protein